MGLVKSSFKPIDLIDNFPKLLFSRARIIYSSEGFKSIDIGKILEQAGDRHLRMKS